MNFEAEREASKIVEQARQFRTKRVKQARDEAKSEIEDHREEMEKKFKAFESEHTEGNTAAEQEALKDAEVQIKELKDRAQKHKDKVIGDLLGAVFEAKPAPPAALLAQ
ncbi:unnamed protein product [Parascedosporium putredinis]|uniref:V-type proton ATPase subunit G n=1 Tax=Parascedosporium putredinis TaxID=1442378 RepID=A0A9P1H1N3_9PEZI|nr:unnamed protein product [Parascedosporium putredinis]CAI7995321.1 unnamed protein product [Parascedosporium putredinis]